MKQDGYHTCRSCIMSLISEAIATAAKDYDVVLKDKQKEAVEVFMKGNETFVSLPTDPYSAFLTLLPEPLNLDPQRQQLVSIVSIVAYLHVRAYKTDNCTSLTLHILHVI